METAIVQTRELLDLLTPEDIHDRTWSNTVTACALDTLLVFRAVHERIRNADPWLRLAALLVEQGLEMSLLLWQRDGPPDNLRGTLEGFLLAAGEPAPEPPDPATLN